MDAAVSGNFYFEPKLDRTTQQANGDYFKDPGFGFGVFFDYDYSELAENIDRAKHDPENYYVPAYIGPKGWFGMRLDRGAPDWDEVRNIVENSYRIVAPKTLARRLDEQPA